MAGVGGLCWGRVVALVLMCKPLRDMECICIGRMSGCRLGIDSAPLVPQYGHEGNSHRLFSLGCGCRMVDIILVTLLVFFAL